MSKRTAPRSRSRSSAKHQRRKRPEHRDRPEVVSDGAAAAERASAGMGTEDFEPTDWLFGNSLTGADPRPY